MEKKFMTGDKVKITRKNSRWKDKVGEVVELSFSDNLVKVKVSERKILTLSADGLELVMPSPASPKAVRQAFAKETLKNKVRQVMQEGTHENACERLAEAFLDSVNTDDESLDKIGYFLLKAFLDDDVDGAVIALCGWSIETLLIRAKILPDTQGLILGDD